MLPLVGSCRTGICVHNRMTGMSHTLKSESGDGWNKKVKAAGGWQNQSSGTGPEKVSSEWTQLAGLVLWTMVELGVDADHSED